MKFPAYWSRATAEGQRPDGTRKTAACWQWSDVSQQDAEQSALDSARRILQKMISGEPLGRQGYGYGVRPLREEVLQRFTNGRGELVAAITQNAWGALVLNAAGAMFVDVDFPEVTAGELLGALFRRLLGRSAAAPEEQHESAARGRLEDFANDHPAWAMRVYRTRAGLRALATHDVFDPTAAATLNLFEALGADPTYVRLCKAQASFRARLTPKPWRCGHTVNHARWPRQTPEEQALFDRWQATYVEKQSRYATCRFLGTLGGGAIHPDIAPIIEVHDQVSRAGEPLELA